MRVDRTLAYLVLSLFTAAVLIPFLLIALTSLKTPDELGAGLLTLPEAPQWGNYLRAWTEGNLRRYFLNSLIVIVPVVVVTPALAAMCAYALALLPLPGRRTLFAVLLLGLVVPYEGLIIPLYYGLRSVGLLNTYLAMILPLIALSLPFGTYLLWATFKSLPDALIDAAVLDGAGRMTVFRHVLLPLARPTFGVLTIFLFIWNWNEFFIPLVMVSDDALRTLPVGIAFFQGRYTTDIPLLAAGATIVAAPLVVVYLAFQRQFISGLVKGAVD
ncbi:MAG: carbohydrate ABC transporter permease [Trueperaceae bacterium]|nr:carbohydrate ABC transporter permease [Trueperaceae bacterium]